MTLKVRISTVTEDGEEKENVGHFYIPTRADLKWLQKNVPYLIRAAQGMSNELLAEEEEE